MAFSEVPEKQDDASAELIISISRVFRGFGVGFSAALANVIAENGYHGIYSPKVRARSVVRGRGEPWIWSCPSWDGLASKIDRLADAGRRPLAFHATVSEGVDYIAYVAAHHFRGPSPRLVLADKEYRCQPERPCVQQNKVCRSDSPKRRSKRTHGRKRYKKANLLIGSSASCN